MQNLWSRNFVLACFSSFFQFLPFYMLMATLPLFVKEALRGDSQVTGLVVAAFMLSAVLFRPVIGKLVDEYDKKKALLFALLAFLVSSSFYFVAGSVMLLLLVRFMHGLGFSASTTATATTASQLVPLRQKGEGIGYYSLFMSLAMVMGPFLGLTIIARYPFTMLFAVCTLSGVIAFIFGALIQPATGKQEKPQITQRPQQPFSWRSIVEPASVPISLTACLLAIANSGIFSFISLYTQELGIPEAARYFFVMYSLAVIIPRSVVGRIFDRRGPNVVIYPALALFIIGMLFLSQAHTTACILLAGLLLGAGNGVLFSVFQTMAILAAPRAATGLATSTYFFFFDAGMGLGAYCMGSLAGTASFSTMYLFSASIMLIVTALYYRARRQQVERKNGFDQVGVKA